MLKNILRTLLFYAFLLGGFMWCVDTLMQAPFSLHTWLIMAVIILVTLWVTASTMKDMKRVPSGQ